MSEDKRISNTLTQTWTQYWNFPCRCKLHIQILVSVKWCLGLGNRDDIAVSAARDVTQCYTNFEVVDICFGNSVLLRPSTSLVCNGRFRRGEFLAPYDKHAIIG
ncbi:unnamed protein product [Colias eurytheme]|nr:unnamed protein product [Colias eurytheme]